MQKYLIPSEQFIGILGMLVVIAIVSTATELTISPATFKTSRPAAVATLNTLLASPEAAPTAHARTEDRSSRTWISEVGNFTMSALYHSHPG